MKGTMIVDGQKVEFNGEKHILEVIRKTGIELPTFCYHSELSIYGACRMCMVEDKWGGVMASCSEPPKDGMEVYTNTPKLQKHRKMILELILSNHDRDCTVCDKSGKCKLQELAVRFGIKRVRFGERARSIPVDTSSPSVVRNENKCIMCGDCVRMCEELQGIGVLGFAHRGAKIRVSPAFDRPMYQARDKRNVPLSQCVNCGQCSAVCPTGALLVKNETHKVWSALHDPGKRVIAQIAPAVRVALGEEFGLEAGEIVLGKIAAALRRLGFEEIYDTSIAADITVMEESNEFTERLEKGGALPLFTSCCPAWVTLVENKYPELLGSLSSCRSPQQIFGAVVKEHFESIDRRDGKETCIVSIMPCTAKKHEAARPEYSKNGLQDVDVVITTQELALMIKEAGIDFRALEQEALDMPFGLASGAGVIFGVTGGVAEAVIRRCYAEKTACSLKELQFTGVRGMEGLKEASVEIDGRTITLAVVNGLKNAQELVRRIKTGEKKYDMVEVMACPGGCIGGAGQPVPSSLDTKKRRAGGIYKADKAAQIKRSEENPMIIALYNGILNGKHHLLHHTSRRRE